MAFVSNINSYSSIFPTVEGQLSGRQTDIVPWMPGCSLGWWVALDGGGDGTISQLFGTLTVDLFSHSLPMGHYSRLSFLLCYSRSGPRQ